MAVTIQGQEVNESDAYGMTLTEWIYRGFNWRLRFRGLEWNKTGLLGSLQTFGIVGLAGTLTPRLINVGDRATTYAQALLLTAVLANPPTMPLTLTATNAVVAPNQNFEHMFTSKYREFPMEFVLIPYVSVGNNIPFTTT